jgi:PAS domain S-box-containing protein
MTRPDIDEDELLQPAPDALITIDARGRIVSLNAPARRLFGYDRDELLGEDVEFLVPGAGRRSAGSPLAARRKDGTKFSAEISSSTIETANGVLVEVAVRDATDRVRTEATFRALLDAAPDAIIAVSGNGKIALVNAQAERLFGYRREELLGLPVENLVPESKRAEHMGWRGRYVADPEPRPMGAGTELAARRKDGGEFPAEISLSAIDTEGGVLVSAAIRDVTERHQATETRNRLASIVQSSHDAIVGKSLDGVVTSWNRGAEQLYGYTAAEMIGRPADILFPAGRRDVEAEILDRIGRGERVDQLHTDRLRKDGSTIPVSLTVSPIAHASGAIVGMASVSRDVGERQRAEEKFRGLLEAAPDAIVGVAADGKIALANAQAERLFGYRRDELVGQPVEILVPEYARDAHPRHRTCYGMDPAPRPMGAGMQLAARRKDGSEFPAEISLSSFDTDEGLLISAAIRDVTERLEAHAEHERLKAAAERERLEAQLHQSQRLESLGQLAGGIAHDFNNLLSVMLNYASFVAEEIDDEVRAGNQRWHRAGQDIAQVVRAGERATALTHQLLAFGRREVVRPQIIDLNAVVIEVEQILQRTLGEHVRLVAALTDGLWPVLADPGQLEQVLVNLAVNARHAMPGGGTLSITTGNVRADDLNWPDVGAGRYVELRVADTGAGMPPGVLDRVFEPFFTTKPKGEGSGLGLATVHGIITQAGGHARFQSTVGEGTTFTALLPATDQAPDKPEETPAATAPNRGEEHILVVEDEEALREVTRRILERNGFHVVVAASGPEALDLVEHSDHHFDLLLSDIVMPHMLGSELAGSIRELRPDIGVLFMSGYAQPVLASHGTLDPGVILVEKPFSEADLLQRVREALDRMPTHGGAESRTPSRLGLKSEPAGEAGLAGPARAAGRRSWTQTAGNS